MSILISMENTITQEGSKQNGFGSTLVKEIVLKSLTYTENITVLDLSHSNISDRKEELTLPPSISELNLSHNKLIKVPKFATALINLKILDLSSNCIEYFDDVPKFCDTLEQLNISKNDLRGPPLWIWLCTPRNLEKLDISNNPNITHSLRCNRSGYVIINSKTLLRNMDIHNCKLNMNIDLFQTFSNAKILKLGDSDYNHQTANNLLEVPCQAMDKCCDVEILNLCNTNIYAMKSNIDIYKNLIHMDLSLNFIHSLPDEFCNLLNLEICLLSCNKLLYLPDNLNKLTKLTKLLVDSNELCMLPENMNELENLKVLDLYDNHLYEMSCNIECLEEVDFAQNYFVEVADDDYIQKKKKLRLNHKNRCDGRKLEDYRESDEEFSEEGFTEPTTNPEHPKLTNLEYEPPSSPEDWDSDDYWIPQYCITVIPSASPRVTFVKQNIKECSPIYTPLMEKLNYKNLNLKDSYESDGQFDDD